MIKNKIKCKICQNEVSNGNSYIGSHVKRKHNISLVDYVIKYYNNLGDDFQERKCNLCKRPLVPDLKIDHFLYTYKKIPIDKYICTYPNLSDECKDLISINVFNEPYDRKKFEFIGSRSEYISLLYNIDIKDAKDLKRLSIKSVQKNNPFSSDCEEIYKKKIEIQRSKPSLTNLEDYKKRYGEYEGEIKYMSRCYKISVSNNIKWYIEKYGESEGNKKWNERIKKYEKSRGSSISRSQLSFYNDVLSKLNCKIHTEYRWERNGRKNYIDFFIPEKKLVIEYFGDYWHCNPKKYPSEIGRAHV